MKKVLESFKKVVVKLTYARPELQAFTETYNTIMLY